MTIRVLGISALYHDAAAALVVDGTAVAALEEERVTRNKHDARLPIHAIQYCLEEARIKPSQLDAIVFYDDAILTWDRVLRSAATVGAGARDQFREAARRVLGNKVWIEAQIMQHLGSLGRAGRLLTVRHHMSHAASAFYPAPFQDAAIIVADGVGEWATTSIGAGRGGEIELLKEIRYPHSLGLLYSAFTELCGFKVNDGEYKLMGLAPYGTPRYASRIRDHVVDLKPDGSFRLDCQLFDFMAGRRMVTERLEALFDGPTRAPDAPITQRDKDLAASIQVVLQEILLGLARHAKALTGAHHVVLAGGVALNCVANGVLRRSRIFDDVWIQPAAGDAGGALGAALAVSHQHFEVPRRPQPGDAQNGSRLGPRFRGREVRAFLDRHNLAYEVVPDPARRAERIAEALAKGQVVGLFTGRAELGPRALGQRSILADPRDPNMQDRINALVKRRESFRPFAPAVLRERASEYFEVDDDSPYMLFVAPVRAHFVAALPAITHVDHSARVQTVDDRHPEFAAILRAFERSTGCPILLNTSFNVKDEPIVGSPRDAYLCFERAGLDLLVLEDCLIQRPPHPDPVADQDDAPELGSTLAEAEQLRAAVELADRQRRDSEAAVVSDRLFDALIPRLCHAWAGRHMPLGAEPSQPTYFSGVWPRDDGFVAYPADGAELETRLSSIWADLPGDVGREAAVACAHAAVELRDNADPHEHAPLASLYVMF